MKIDLLSKSELVLYNEKLVRELLIKQGYEVVKVLGNKVQTKYKIYKNNQSYTIKIMGYRYNDKARGNYAWVKKQNFELEEYDFLYFVLYYFDRTHILKIPTEVFKRPSRDKSAFKSHDYWNKKTAPEYGIAMKKDTICELLQYEEKLLQ